MEVSFDYSRERQSYMIRFQPGHFETAPFLTEVRFWGVDRFPCPQMSLLAALIVLQDHPKTSITVPEAPINPPVCSVLADHFGTEIVPAKYDINSRRLAGGDLVIAPRRFRALSGWSMDVDGAEILTWASLNDLRGPLGGEIRTNLDAFDLAEPAKDLIVALCCAGQDAGHLIVSDADPDMARVLHRIGMELINPET